MANSKPKPKRSANRVSAAKRKRVRRPAVPVPTFPAETFAKPLNAADGGVTFVLRDEPKRARAVVDHRTFWQRVRDFFRGRP